jgi:hypothetical protein
MSGLQCHREEVVILTEILPSVGEILNSRAVQHVELDASLCALRRYVDLIACAAIANNGIHRGLVMTPTERQKSSELFYPEMFRSGKVNAAEITTIPLLSDEEKALEN